MKIVTKYIPQKDLFGVLILMLIIAAIEFSILKYMSEILTWLIGTAKVELPQIEIIFFLLLLSAAKLFLGPYSVRQIYRLTYQAQLNISLEIFKKALRVDSETFNYRPLGDWMNAANNETALFTSGYLNSYITRCTELCILSAVIGFILWSVSPVFIALVLGLAVILTPSALFLNKRIRVYGKKRQGFENLRVQQLKDGLTARDLVQNTGFTEQLIKKYEDTMSSSNKVQILKAVAHSIPRYVLECIGVILLALAALFGIFFDFDNSKILSEIAILCVAMVRMIPSINRILMATNEISFSLAPLTLINELAQLDEKLAFDNHGISKNGNLIEVNYRRTEKSKFSSFSAKKGDIIAFVGPSGSGKSRILKTVAQLFRHNANVELKIDVDTKISYISQEPYAFSASIRYNIIADRTDISKRELTNSLSELGLKYLDLDEKVGDGGRKLSGGELMRLNIMRAYFSGANIIILDETLSSLSVLQRDSIMSWLSNSKLYDAILYATHNSEDLKYATKIVDVEKVDV